MTNRQRAVAALLLAVGAGCLATCGAPGLGAVQPRTPLGASGHRPAGGGVDELPPAGERWALVVGIGRYDDPNIHPLYGDSDATAFASVLERRAGFPDDHIIMLAGQRSPGCHPGSALDTGTSAPAEDPTSQPCKATRGNFWQRLSELTSRMHPTGLFLLFFSGHGKYVAGEAVLLPADIKFRDEDNYLKAAGLRATEIAETIRASNIKQVLIFLDACRDQLHAAKGTRPDVISKKFQEKFDLAALNANVDAFLTFFSSQPGAPSFEDRKEKRSYFTSELLHAFNGEGNVLDERKLLTLDRLIRSVEDNVRARVQRDLRTEQRPNIQLGGYRSLDLVIAPGDTR